MKIVLAIALIFLASVACAKDLAPVTLSEEEGAFVINQLLSMQRVISAIDQTSGMAMGDRVASIMAKLQKAAAAPPPPPTVGPH